MQTLEKRFLNVKECAEYLNLGVTSTRKYMQQIGAVKKIGKRAVYDREIIDNYFNNADSLTLSGEPEQTPAEF